MKNCVLLLCLLGSAELSWALPIVTETLAEPEEVRLAEEYLRRFYPLTKEGGPRGKREAVSMETKIRAMQDFMGLEVNGLLDPPTLAEMRRERCGVPDVENYSFYPDKPRWRNHTITYRIQRYTSDLSKEEVDRSFLLALKIWSDAAPLKFVKVDRGEADIMLTFGSKGHGDFFPFDGPRGVLAHAFEPGEGMGGDVHFDEDETWTTGRPKFGYNLFTVAAHELGHSLGLSHSRDPSALMYPSYKYDNAQHTLPKDDTLGIQALYGSYKTRKPETLAVPERCDPNLSFDAVAVIGQEVVFIKNSYMWLRTSWGGYWNRLSEGYSSTYLPGVSSPVDAAYNIPAKGVAYVFTGPKYWTVQGLNSRSHHSSIYDYGLPTRVERIDAAVHISEYGKTYFFVGEVYYRFYSGDGFLFIIVKVDHFLFGYDETRHGMDSGYPRKIATDWPGVGRKVDAAFEQSGFIHFFSGTKASCFDYRQRRVQYVVKANSWLGC